MPLLPLPNCQRTNRKTNGQGHVILRHNLGWAEAGSKVAFAPSPNPRFESASNHQALPRILLTFRQKITTHSQLTQGPLATLTHSPRQPRRLPARKGMLGVHCPTVKDQSPKIHGFSKTPRIPQKTRGLNVPLCPGSGLEAPTPHRSPGDALRSRQKTRRHKRPAEIFRQICNALHGHVS